MDHFLFQTNRIGLRYFRETDFPSFASMNKDAKVMQYMGTLLEESQSRDFFERIQQHYQAHGYGLYALELLENGNCIGYTGFAHPRFEAWFTPCVEIGWRIQSAYWNQGYATEAAKACLVYGFSKLGFSTLYSFTSIHNLPSERVMQKIGMEKIGEFEHPKLEEGHWLRRHVLYKIEKKDLAQS